MPEFERRADDAVRVRLRASEAGVLAGLEGQLREILELEDGPVRERLFPRAYLDPTEAEAEAEWQRHMHGDLLRSKLSAAEVFAESLSGVDATSGSVVVDLAASEVEAWLGALNDLRLALGVMLEITPEFDPSRIRADDPRAPGLNLYAWLTWLFGGLIEAVDPRQPGDPF